VRHNGRTKLFLRAWAGFECGPLVVGLFFLLLTYLGLMIHELLRRLPSQQTPAPEHS